jgi:hypothetical protein
MIDLQYLLSLAQSGYRIFPLVPGTKEPLIGRGFKKATTDPKQIEAWWRVNPQANLGLACFGLIAIDIDPVNGGPNPWPLDPSQRDDLAKAMIQTTPRGGTHCLFRLPVGKVIKNSAGKLAPGVDVRSSGGYIVLAPSAITPTDKHPGGAYQGLAQLPPKEQLPEPPAWLLAALEAIEEPKPAPAQQNALVPYQSGPATKKMERARAWLAKVEPAIEGQGGSNTTYRAAVALFEKFDLDPSEAWQLLTEYNQRCLPPWDDKDLLHKLEDANKKYQGPRGTLLLESLPQADPKELDGLREIIASFEASSVIVQQPGFTQATPRLAKRIGLIATPLPELLARCGGLEWIWTNWIGRGMLHLVTGDSGVGKTTVLFDILARIYANAPLPDGTLPVPGWGKRPLLYIDADLRASHQLSELAGKYGVDRPLVDVVEMQNENDPVPRTVSTWEDSPKLFGELAGLVQSRPYWCIIVDTVSRFAGSSRLEVVNELSKWVSPLQRIARDFGIPIFLVGHANAGGGALGRHLVGACQLGWHIDGNRKLTQSRSYAAPSEPLQFDFTETGPLVWGTQAKSKKDGPAVKRAEDWILNRLKELGEMPSHFRDLSASTGELKRSAKEQGIPTSGTR